jgi:hypothetical protein
MTPREPDRFDKQAADVLKAVMDAERRGDNMDPIIAAALRAAESSALERALGRDKPWSIADVLDKLADAAAHLLNDHNCDEHGWELVQGCVPRARAYASDLRALIPPAAAPAAEPPIRAVPMMPVDEAADTRIDALRAAQPRETSRPIAPAADQDEVATFGAFGHGEPAAWKDYVGKPQPIDTLLRDAAAALRSLGDSPLVRDIEATRIALAARAAPPEGEEKT